MEVSVQVSVPRQAYSTDLTDDQWEALQERLPKAINGRTGRKRKHPLREVVNGLFYQLRTGCPWRDLPHDLPPWETVYDQFRRWRNDGTIECLHDDLRQEARKQQGRDASPSAAILDSQSVKTGEKGGRAARLATMPTRRSKAVGVT
jgi:transposase